MLLVSHVVFVTGQIYPIRDICRLAASRNLPVIVDGAHAFAQFPFTRDELGCDYYGTSLHKWLMAPVGTGFLSVRKSKIEGLWPLMAGTAEQKKDIRKFEEIGTHPAANHNAIGEALTFHEMIGSERKAARLRYLRSRWTDKIRSEPNVRFHTNLAPAHSCGLATVQILGVDHEKLAAWLLDKQGIFVTPIAHDQFKGIRVTPNVYSTVDEIDRFASAMLTASKEGIGA
jgi:selenocysteine lyase/cysteine desulfurase